MIAADFTTEFVSLDRATLERSQRAVVKKGMSKMIDLPRERVPRRHDSLCVLVDDVLNEEECDHLISLARPRLRYVDSFQNEAGESVKLSSPRDYKLALFADPLSELLFRRLASIVPQRFGEEIVAVNRRLRVLHYSQPGECFPGHVDYSVEDGDRRSLVTVLIYLNDGFDGGETIFYDEVKITPKRGSALLFDHDLWHCGAPLIRGDKFILRTDLMFPSKASIPHVSDGKEEALTVQQLLKDVFAEPRDTTTHQLSRILDELHLLDATLDSFRAPGRVGLETMLLAETPCSVDERSLRAATHRLLDAAFCRSARGAVTDSKT